MSILDFLRGTPRRDTATKQETETVRKIVRELDQLEPDRAKYVAAFAYLLSRVARADLKVDAQETRVMERLVAQLGELPEEQAVIVVQMAKNQNVLFGGTENYLVTREFNGIATHEQKLSLLKCLFAVAASDQSVSTVEDNEISQIADELRIEHRDFIAVRSQYRDYLAVLKRSKKE